jgi:hypothetical protein
MGFLPYAGGLYDQPERLLEMIETMTAAHARDAARRRQK